MVPIDRWDTVLLLSSLLCAGVFASGCLSPGGPPAHLLPVQLHNGTTSPLQTFVAVQEPFGNTTLYSDEFLLGPGERIFIDRIRLVPGPYTLLAQAGANTREANVEFDGSASYYRFEILDDVIAFQAGDR